MQRPFEMGVVDALIANALQKSFDIGSPALPDPPHRAEGLAGRILSSRADIEIFGYDPSVHVIAGFELAVRLCCRILADPFRVHPGGVRRDVNLVLTWLDRHRENRKGDTSFLVG